MYPGAGTPLLAPALLALLLATASCGGGDLAKLREAENLSYLLAPRPAPPDPRLMRALAGEWRMEAKEGNALVPNIVFRLQPDGRLEFLRDDAGGTNFSLRFSGSWAAASPAPGRVEVTFDFAEAEPSRRCLSLPGLCEDYILPFQERWAFNQTGPGTMETPGAVWRRAPLTPAMESSEPDSSGGPTPAAASSPDYS